MASLENVEILVVGGLHAHAVERLEERFSVTRIDKGDASVIPDVDRGKYRAIAASGAVDAALIDALPKLEIIANFGVGYDSVDAGHAGKKDVMVTNTPDVLTEEVADTAIGLLINAARELPKAENYLRAGNWKSEGAYPLTRGSLRGRKVGIFGMGRIGLAIARRVEAFGLPVSYFNRSKVEGVNYTYHGSLLELAEAVDTLISVAPGTPQTAKAVNADVLSALGADGILVNIGRGSTVDEEALAQALKSGTIMAAGLDVFADEPNVPQALLECENATLLPHVGSASQHTRKAMADLVAQNIISWFEQGNALTPVAETRHVTSNR